jgi:CHASE3 domain sensor protein
MIEDALEVAADELAVKSIKRSAASNMMREAAVELRRLRGTIVHLEGDALAEAEAAYALLAEALEPQWTGLVQRR